MKYKNLFALTTVLFSTNVSIAARDTVVSDSLLQAIHMTESGGKLTSPLGDNGKARGPLQIHYSYWKDAVQYDPNIGGTYDDCDDLEYSKKIVRAYMKRYAPSGATPEQIARIHNNGPSALKKSKTSRAWLNTTLYWEKVRKHLAKQ